MFMLQGIRLIFFDDFRIIFRFSGIGSSGVIIRMYLEGYESDLGKYDMDLQVYIMVYLRYFKVYFQVFLLKKSFKNKYYESYV